MSIKGKKVKPLSIFRKIAIGSWKNANEASIHGLAEYNAENALKYIDKYNKKYSTQITVMHLLSLAIAKCMKENPSLNRYLRLCSVYQRENIDFFFMVNISDDKNSLESSDLSGVRIENIDALNLDQLNKQLNSKITDVRKHRPNDLWMTRLWVLITPNFLIRYAINLYAFLSFDLNLNLKFLGFPKDIFGSMIVTNLGAIGIPNGVAPLVNASRTPLILNIGEIKSGAFVENNQLTIKPLLKIALTVDHRIFDGIHGAKLSKTIESVLSHPAQYFGVIE